MLETQSTQWHWYSSVSEHGERNKERWLYECNCCSIVQSCLTLWPHGLQHTRLPCPSLSPRVCSNSCPLSWWSHDPTRFHNHGCRSGKVCGWQPAGHTLSSVCEVCRGQRWALDLESESVVNIRWEATWQIGKSINLDYQKMRFQDFSFQESLSWVINSYLA